ETRRKSETAKSQIRRGSSLSDFELRILFWFLVSGFRFFLTPMPDPDRPKSFLKPDILARITALGLRAQRVMEGTISGLHRSPMHGVSVEFADYREYSPGDDLKRLDWRAYARTNRHFIKQYEEESNLRATLLVDASASMKYGRGAMSKFNYAA